MDLNKEIYSSVAVFKCTCCNYEEEIYSDIEWLKEVETKVCEKCKYGLNKHFDPGVIHREDIFGEVPLHPQCAALPAGCEFCDKCIGLEKIHWTRLLVHCPKCEKKYDGSTDTMKFSHFVKGKHYYLFRRQCEEGAKLSFPCMVYTNEKGHEIWHVNGVLSNVCAN